MRLFYVSHWGVFDGLSVASIYPNLEILNDLTSISEIHFFSVERDINFDSTAYSGPKKVVHHPIAASQSKVHLLSRGGTFWNFWQGVKRKVTELKPDQIICRGAMAGVIGYWLHKKFKLPYHVESFEPHADYMLESGVWSRRGIKYQFQRFFEEKIKQTATTLITVSYNYKRQLQKEGFNASKIETVPCIVPLERFSFSEDARNRIHTELNILKGDKVGVYVGKFGGMYYDDEAFDLFKRTSEFFNGQFYLIVLSPDSRDVVFEKLRAIQFDTKKCFVNRVPHSDVPMYLAAGDFAYSLHKKSPVKKALSPIKDGEYWAMGLPILIPPGIGDDSDIIQEEGGGAVFDYEQAGSVEQALSEIAETWENEDYRESIRALAQKHRSLEKQVEVYKEIFT